MKRTFTSGALLYVLLGTGVLAPAAPINPSASATPGHTPSALLSRVPEILPLLEAAGDKHAESLWDRDIGTPGHALQLLDSQGRLIGEMYRLRALGMSRAILLLDGSGEAGQSRVRLYELDWPLGAVAEQIDTWKGLNPRSDFVLMLVSEGDQIIIRLVGAGGPHDLDRLPVSPRRLGLIKAD